MCQVGAILIFTTRTNDLLTFHRQCRLKCGSSAYRTPGVRFLHADLWRSIASLCILGSGSGGGRRLRFLRLGILRPFSRRDGLAAIAGYDSEQSKRTESERASEHGRFSPGFGAGGPQETTAIRGKDTLRKSVVESRRLSQVVVRLASRKALASWHRVLHFKQN